MDACCSDPETHVHSRRGSPTGNPVPEPAYSNGRVGLASLATAAVQATTIGMLVVTAFFGLNAIAAGFIVVGIAHTLAICAGAAFAHDGCHGGSLHSRAVAKCSGDACRAGAGGAGETRAAAGSGCPVASDTRRGVCHLDRMPARGRLDRPPSLDRDSRFFHQAIGL